MILVWTPIAIQDACDNDLGWERINDAPLTIREARYFQSTGEILMAQKRVGDLIYLVVKHASIALPHQAKKRPTHVRPLSFA